MELSEALFGPNGAFAQAAGTREERERLLQHPLYKRAHARLSELRADEVARFEADVALGSTAVAGTAGRTAPGVERLCRHHLRDALPPAGAGPLAAN